METNFERYARIVRLYHTHGREVWRIARESMEAELGEEEMENLSNRYDVEYTSMSESDDSARHEAQYR